MDVRELVAWNLRRLRVARGIAQEALAVDAEIDRTYVSRLERSMENPTVLVLSRIAKALDCEIVEFFAVPRAGASRPATLPKGRRPQASRAR